ncbi:MAG: UvrD-helicase domain-containing protein, partial [Clostridia bacterium]|nr:UvrD-helicase domain-containing protein [Clostridia bacterium]
MKKIIISGGTGTGKTTRLINEYKRLVEEGNIRSEEILVLLMNRNQSLSWREKSILNVSGRIIRTSFFGFVQEEVTTFYPLILKSVPEIKTRSVKPVFLTFESSQYLLSMLIESRRNSSEAFSTLADRDSKIAIDISSDFVKA